MNPPLAFRALVAALACLVLLPAAAFAHPALKQAAPSPGLVTPGPAEAIDLAFSEPVVPAGSRVVLRRLGGQGVALGGLRAGSGNLTLSAPSGKPLVPGLYRVEWTALGADGHTVSGEFSFGLSDKDGNAPEGAQEQLAVGSRGGPGDQRADGEGPLAVVARWLGLLAASILLGGWALLRLARLRGALAPEALAAAERRWGRIAPVAWAAALVAAAVAVVLNAAAGAGSGLDLGLLRHSPTGRGAALVLVILLAGTAALAVLRRRRPSAAAWVLAAGGLAVLVGEAATGHVQTLVGGGRMLAVGLQIVHSLSAGVWLGGLVVLAALSIRPGAGLASPLGPLARAFAPLAAGALGLATVTGVVAAFREVEHGYFLRWSAYGNLVLVKGALVLVAGAAGAYAFWRTRRRGTPARGLLRAETALVAVVLGVAAALAGLVPGRGQALPAQQGTLVPGPAFATAIAAGGPLRVSLAPAREGANVLSVLQESALGLPPADPPEWVEARLFRAGSDEELVVDLRPGPGGALSAPLELPADGDWYAKLIVEGTQTAPVALPAGVPSARGSSPLTVLTIGDLSGAGARRCRAHLLGLELGVARLNALGGVDGGRKVALVGLDHGGSAATARRAVADALGGDDPVALVAPCGSGSEAAVAEAAAAGLPAIVADPAVPLVAADGVFRLAGDPYAEGFAAGEFVRTTVAPSARASTVRAVSTGTADSDRRIAGLRAALRATKMTLEVLTGEPLAVGPDELRALLDAGSTAALLLDGDPAELAGRLATLGRGQLGFAPAPILAAGSVLSERFVSDSGGIGRIGAVQGAVEVLADSATAAAYSRTLPRVFPGEQPAIDGLRGYVAGLALAEGLRAGTSPGDVAAALLEPAPFADALMTPWRADAPAVGNQRFAVIKGTFLPPTLVPASSGGETYAGTWFADGAWSRISDPVGPPLERPVPPL